MRQFFLLFIFFLALESVAALSPRMYSVIAQGGFNYRQTNDNFQSRVLTHKVDLNILYFERSGATVGFSYFIESRNEVSNETGEAYGPAVGYYWDRGWFILGHYYLARLGDWTNGRGPQIDVGYLEHIGGHFHIGFQMSDRTIVYNSNRTNPLAEARTVKDTYPSLTLMYLF